MSNMNPELLSILKKSKAVEAKTNAIYGSSGGPNTHGGSKSQAPRSLYEEIDGSSLITAEEAGIHGMGGGVPVVSRITADNPNYETMVENSNLPPEIRKAMKINPIPQPDMATGYSEEDIRELNPNYGREEIIETYSDDDEHDFMAEQRHEPRKRSTIPQQPTNSGISEKMIKKMIAEEIARVLPKIVSNYFDNKVIKENTRLMKYIIKNSQPKKRL